MSLSDRFTRDPVLTTVCSLVILWIGADARTTFDTVTRGLEKEIHGVEDRQSIAQGWIATSPG